jgi:hypothetical protein
VSGESAGGDGVLGRSSSPQHAGVSAVNDKGGFGVWARGTPGGHFEATGTDALFGTSTANAIVGVSTSPDHSGVLGMNDSGGYGVWGRGRVAGHFEGDVEVVGTLTASVDIILQTADCAEEFPVDGDVVPGTVMAVGDGGRLRVADREYDTRVAGVVAGAGGLRPGLVLGSGSGGPSGRRLALVGRAFCLADATVAPICVGDLLTTASRPGHAMRASDRRRAFGAVLGKALAPLAEGCGLIPVLLALQ